MWLWIECNDCGYTGEAFGVWMGESYEFQPYNEQLICVVEGHDFDVKGGA